MTNALRSSRMSFEPFDSAAKEHAQHRRIHQEEDAELALELKVFNKEYLTRRGKVAMWLIKRGILQTIEVIQGLLSFAWSVLYVVSTYYDSHHIPTWVKTLDYIFAGTFICYFILYFYLAKNRIEYSYSYGAIIDYVSIVPIFFGSYSLGFVRALRALALVRVLRLLRTFNLLIANNDYRLFVYLVSSIVGLFYVGSSIMLLIEPEEFENWHTALYFVVVTFTTVGYGDHAPKTTLGQVVMMALIISAIVLVSAQAYYFNNMLHSHEHLRRSQRKFRGAGPHVIVTGSLDEEAVAHFFNNFFHEVYGRHHYRVVVLSAKDDLSVDKTLASITGGSLLHKRHKEKMNLLHGSPMNARDLLRVKIETAQACFVFCDLHAEDVDEEDQRTLMTVLSIKWEKSKTQVYCQVHKPETREMLSTLANVWCICVDELRYGTLAKSVLLPGFASMISTLILPDVISKYADIKYVLGENPELEPYVDGVDFGIYRIRIPEATYIPFPEAVYEFYEKFQVILFAIEADAEGDVRPILLNPGVNFTVRTGQHGFVIARSKKIYDKILKRGGNVAENERDSYASRRVSMGDTPFIESKEHMLYSHCYLRSDSESHEDYMHLDTPRTLKESKLNDFLKMKNDALKKKKKGKTQNVTNASADYKMKGHVIVTGEVWKIKELLHFIAPLRHRALTKKPKIIILCPHEPSEDWWQKIGIFPNVFYHKGSPLHWDSWRACHTKSSRAVVIMSRIEDKVEVDKHTTIAIYLKHWYPTCRIVMDLQSLLSTRLIDSFTQRRTENIEPKLSPSYTGGDIFVSTVIDSLLVKAFFDRHVDVVISMIIGLNGGSINRTNIHVIPVPKDSIGQSFLSCFQDLALGTKGVVPIAIFRTVGDNTMVITCPKRKEKLKRTDKLFIFKRQTTIKLNVM